MTRLETVHTAEGEDVGEVLLTKTYVEDGSMFVVRGGVQLGVVREENGAFVSDRCEGTFKTALSAGLATARTVMASIHKARERRAVA